VPRQPTKTESITYAEWPAVTAIVNTHSNSPLLRRALDSVLEQDYQDFEVIVVHDGPIVDGDPNDGDALVTSPTGSIMQEYELRFAERNIFSFLIATDEPSGYQCVPKNIATHHARGDYIAYLDYDNEWTPDHLSVLVEAIEEGDVWPDFVYGRRLYVKDEGCDSDVTVGESPLVEFDERRVLEMAEDPLKNFIDTSDFLVGKGCLWRLHVQTGAMWNENMRRFGDWELMARACNYGGWRGKAVDKIVQTYHWTGDNMQLVRPATEIPQQVRGDDFESIRVHSDES
jgi:hypothetical protein